MNAILNHCSNLNAWCVGKSTHNGIKNHFSLLFLLLLLQLRIRWSNQMLGLWFAIKLCIIIEVSSWQKQRSIFFLLEFGWKWVTKRTMMTTHWPINKVPLVFTFSMMLRFLRLYMFVIRFPTHLRATRCSINESMCFQNAKCDSFY